MKRAVQYFSDEYLESCRNMTPLQIARFLDDFRLLSHAHEETSPQKPISIRVPERLLNTFRQRCENDGVSYQKKIKELMRAWLLNQEK